MLLVEFCILLYVMLLCEIMHHWIETIACQPSGLSRECNISTVLHFNPPLGGNVTLQSPLLWPHCVYLKDLHKQVFIVINCFHCWKNATIRSKIARTHFQQTEWANKSRQKIVDDIYLMVNYWNYEEHRPQKVHQWLNNICYEHLFLSWRHHCSYNFSFIPAIPSCVLLSLCNSYSCLCVSTLFSEYHWC